MDFEKINSILQNISDTAFSLSSLQWISFFFGILYIIFAIKEKYWCWIFGNISCALLAWISYVDFKLYADSLLQIIYVVLGFWGLYKWFISESNQSIQPEKTDVIHYLPFYTHFKIISIGAIVSIPIGYLLSAYTSAAATYFDTLLTIFSLFATVLTLRKSIENWIYWIAVDVGYIYLYSTRDGYLFALLSLIYALMSIKGYWDWKAKMKHSLHVG